MILPGDPETQRAPVTPKGVEVLSDYVRGALPDFVIIGSMKSGTSTLYEYLDRHPRIFMSTPKEPQYFSFKAQRNEGGRVVVPFTV